MTTARLADGVAKLAERLRQTAGCWDLTGAMRGVGQGRSDAS
jgi:hypothetical protein